VTTKSQPPDTTTWAFTEVAPWAIKENEISWLKDATRSRNELKAEVPRLTSKRLVPPSKRLGVVTRELSLAFLPWYVKERKKELSRRIISRRLREAFARLGPTYIKLGQILSSGQGIFPEEVVQEFSYLRDKVPPESFTVVKETIERDLGNKLSDIFYDFNPEPIAAASIAQVHEAILKNKTEVAVKVQRPFISELVRQDLAVMSWLAPFLVGRIPITGLANPPALVELFADTILEELDFRVEAQNMLDIAKILKQTEQSAIVVPRPHPTLVTRRVLVMQRLSGFSWDNVEGMRKAGIDTSKVLRACTVSFFEGAMFYGVFHGDLHGGNLFVMKDGKVALLDYGITGRLNEFQRLSFMKIIVSGIVGDVRSQVEAFRDLGALPLDVNIDKLIDDLGLHGPVVDPTTLSAEEIITEVQKIVKALLNYGAKMPKELMLFVKNMLFMDSAVANLAPDIDILQEIIDISTYFAQRHGERIAQEIGINPKEVPIDIDQVKSSFGLTPDVQHLTYNDIQKRREIIKSRFQNHRKIQPKRNKL
jgi:ubiquinone biosynthesis protein